MPTLFPVHLYLSVHTQSASAVTAETLPASPPNNFNTVCSTGDDGDDFGQFETATMTPTCTSSSGHALTPNGCSTGTAVVSGYDTTSMVT